MLVNWIEVTDRPQGDLPFSVVDALATDALGSEEMAHLVQLLESARISADVRDRLLARAGWEAFDERAGRHPTVAGQRGEWGEAFLYGLLEELRELIVPVKKLRFKLARGQFQPGTDIVAFRMDEEDLIEVAYFECKLSTYVDNSLAHQAYEQLLEDSRLSFADILGFMDQVLAQSQSAIALAFRDFLTSRQTRPADETFHVALIFDETVWREKCLTNLAEEDIELAPLEVVACRLRSLAEMVEACYGALDVAPEEEGQG